MLPARRSLLLVYMLPGVQCMTDISFRTCALRVYTQSVATPSRHLEANWRPIGWRVRYSDTTQVIDSSGFSFLAGARAHAPKSPKSVRLLSNYGPRFMFIEFMSWRHLKCSEHLYISINPNCGTYVLCSLPLPVLSPLPSSFNSGPWLTPCAHNVLCSA